MVHQNLMVGKCWSQVRRHWPTVGGDLAPHEGTQDIKGPLLLVSSRISAGSHRCFTQPGDKWLQAAWCLILDYSGTRLLNSTPRPAGDPLRDRGLSGRLPAITGMDFPATTWEHLRNSLCYLNSGSRKSLENAFNLPRIFSLIGSPGPWQDGFISSLELLEVWTVLPGYPRGD